MAQKWNRIIALALLPVLALAFSFSARADDMGDKGRDIFKKYQHSVVTITVVQKTTSERGPRENKAEFTGTVVDPSGLIVTSLASCDPMELSRRLSEQFKGELEVSDVKILLEDGTELAAEIVLRDKDLDLAFIRPKVKPTTPMAAVDLSKSSHAQVLDQVVTLNRLRRAAGRAFAASPERICAVVQKPRTFYIPDSSQTETGLGSPAFAMDGSIVGLIVMRAVNAQGAASFRDCVTAIILPAEDIAKAAAQAPTEAKPDEEKKDTATKSDNKDKDSTAKPDAK